MDRDRAGAGNDYRHTPGTRGDDGSPPTDRTEPRVWSVVRHAGGHVGILPARTGCAAVHDGRAFSGSHSRGADVYGKFDGRGKIAGSAATAADHLPGPEHREPRNAGGCHRHCRDAGDASGKDLLISRDDHYSADFWGDDDHPDWRRGHANGYLALELLRGTFGSGYGFCPPKQAADHRRSARRSVGFHSVCEHVESDEPFVYQRAVWRIRTRT